MRVGADEARVRLVAGLPNEVIADVRIASWTVNDSLKQAEGWCLDPYGRHEQRWFSAGKPTALVRDDGVEGHDAPPAEPPPSPPVPAPEIEVPAEAAYDAQNATDQAFTAAFGNIGVQP